ncbi:MAG: hypothetical protein ACI4DY_00900 [Monoglobaceae bacterium]
MKRNLMKRIIDKTLSVTLAWVLLMTSFVAVYATGDGTNSVYPGPDEYKADHSENNDTIITGYNTTTPEGNLFSVDGVPFILLDTDSNGNYFVMCEYVNGNNAANYWFKIFESTVADTYAARKFDPTNQNHLAYTINNNISTYVPDVMQSEILNTTWYFNKDYNNEAATNSATCKLALPSVNELREYQSKIGFPVFDNLPSGILTRDLTYRATASENQYYPLIMGKYSTYGIVAKATSYNELSGKIRPVFFLDKDFFKKVAVDVNSSLGSAAKEEIKKYSINDLNSVYSTAELTQLGFDTGLTDESGKVPEGYRTSLNSYTSAKIKDTSGAEINSEHSLYNSTGNGYNFTIGGVQFVLLGEDEEGDHFVSFQNHMMETSNALSGKNLWTAKTSTTASDYVYRTDNTNSIASTLNSEDWINSNIPSDMKDYLKTKTWWTEHDVEEYEDINLWKTEAKIAIPSYTEIMNSVDRYPYGNVPSNGDWLRSFKMEGGNTIRGIRMIKAGNAVQIQPNEHYTLYLRPVFYLDKDFFKYVKPSDMGDGVKAYIRGTYDISELIGVYDAQDLIALGFSEKDVMIAADRVLLKGYPDASAYSAALSGGKSLQIPADDVTPAENIFTADDKKFIYLDADENGNMFVMLDGWVKEASGVLPFSTSATTDAEKLYDVSNAGSAAALFNGADYINKAIPTAMQDYLVEKDWYVEKNGAAHSTKAKLALPSMTELIKYAPKIGGWKTISGNNSVTRTPSYNGTDAIVSNYYLTASQNSDSTYTASGRHISAYGTANQRAVFFLSRDYFLDHKIDVDNDGANVKQFLRASFTKDELKIQGYTEEELTKIGYSEAPLASNVAITAESYAVGQTLTGSYTYVPDATEFPEDASKTKYQWYRASSSNGEYFPIDGATGATYTLTDADDGRYIKFGVKPANIDSVGSMYYSLPTPAIGVSTVAVKSLKLTDQDGHEITPGSGVNGATSLTVTATINNTDAEADSKTIIIAVYDGENVLKAVKPATVTIASGENEYTVTADGLTAGAGYKAAVMIWSDLNTMKPLYGEKF